MSSSSFAGIGFRELVQDAAFVLGWEGESTIDVQSAGDSVNFDIGDPGPETIELPIRCSHASLTALRSAARVGQDGTLIITTETRYALLQAVKSVRRHSVETDEWFATLSLLSP